MIGDNKDIIALKLAQESYLLAGDGSNSLNCIARWMHLFDSSDDLHGHVMGMFSAGLLECGRYVDAEEMALKAVTKTKGQDVFAIHTLCNAYVLLGRSSELGSLVSEYTIKHRESTIGLPLLLYSKGLGLMMRGNSTGALRTYDEMILNIKDNKELQVAGTLSNITLLLWIIDINNPSHLVDERWRSDAAVSGMWLTGLIE